MHQNSMNCRHAARGARPSGYPLHELTQEISDSSAAGPRPTPNSMEPSCPDFIGLHVQILSVFMLASPVPT